MQRWVLSLLEPLACFKKRPPAPFSYLPGKETIQCVAHEVGGKNGGSGKKKGDSNLVPGSLQFPFDYSRKWLKGRDVPKEILIKCCCFTIPAFFLLSPISLSFWHLKISNSSISKLFDVCWWLLILLSQDGGMWSQAPRVWRCVAWVFGPSKEFSWESKGTPPPNATATPPRK